MQTYYTTQRTIVCAIPLRERTTVQSLKSIGFQLDYIKDGRFFNKPHTSFWGGWTAFKSDAEAIEHFTEAWEKHKRCYERDGWTAIQTDDSMDIVFVSPDGVLNIFTDWIIRKTKQ